MWLKRHWQSALGLATIAPAICKAVWGLVGHAGDADFLLSHIRDVGWAGDMIAWLLNPPSWSIIPIILAGLSLIFWDVRRKGPGDAARSAALPIAVSYVGRQIFHNFAGFYPPGSEEDAQLLSFGLVTVTNISRTERLALEFYLKIDDAPLGPALIPADLRGPLDFMYGADDAGLKRARAQSGSWMDITLPDTNYFRNPVNIDPQKTHAACLVFLFLPFYFDRNDVLEYINKPSPRLSLQINDLVSGAKLIIAIPGEHRSLS